MAITSGLIKVIKNLYFKPVSWSFFSIFFLECVKKYHGSASDNFINSALRDHFKKYRKQAEKAAPNREQAGAAAANQQPPPDV